MVAGIDVACQADADGQEARLFLISILPALAEFWRDRGMIRITPLELQRDVGGAPLVAVGRGGFGSSKHVVLHVPFAAPKCVEPIGAKIAIESQRPRCRG